MAFGWLYLGLHPTFPLILSIFDPNSPGHDCAMGLAEKSDALVGVVSEERGKIAVFKMAVFGG